MSDPAKARAALAEHSYWYHTIEVATGVETPGWFDLRPIVDTLPWPDVEGKRCLEVGPYDGFLSFELERRGAREVVAADIASPADWDWPVLLREKGPETIRRIAGDEPGAGFRLAKDLLGSKVERVEVSIYDLTPERVGEFDIVICGSLMLHLRDPVRGLEAIRGVCAGNFMSSETIDPALSLWGRRRPRAVFRGGDRGQWWLWNPAGHRKLLESAGFQIERTTRPYSIPLGPGHPRVDLGWGSVRDRLLNRVVTGASAGVAHVAALARPI